MRAKFTSHSLMLNSLIKLKRDILKPTQTFLGYNPHNVSSDVSNPEIHIKAVISELHIVKVMIVRLQMFLATN